MMKLLLTIVFLISPVVSSAGDWYTKSFSQDSKNHYYVGVSEGMANLNDGLEEAYQNAIDEALRHNFGFTKKGQKNIQSSLIEMSVDERSFIKTQTITIRDVQPGRQKVKKTAEGKYLVYREVIYPKEAIEREKNRLKSLKRKEETPYNEYGLEGKKLGSAFIRTNPSHAQILLTRVDGSGSVIGTGDAHFRVPLGKYYITILKDGHEPLKETVLISGKEVQLNFQLKENLGFLKLDVTPKNAKIYIDNRKAENGTTIPLKVSREYTVRIEHGDYQTHVQSVSPWINQTITLENELVPKPGRLTILSQPTGAQVFLDGEPVGKTPLKNLSYFPDAKLQVKVKKAGFEPAFEEIELKANQDHSPLVFTLSKEKKRVPTSYSYDYEETSSESWFSLDFMTNNSSRHNWIYNPVVMEGEKANYILVPLQYQYFLFRHIALGFDYRYHLETEEIKINDSKYDKEIVDQVWSVNSTFYLVRNKSFSLGVGPEYTWRKESIRYLKPGTQSRVASFSNQQESFGYKGHVQIGLWERANGHRGGLNLDFRQYDSKNPNLGSWSVGVYWEF